MDVKIQIQFSVSLFGFFEIFDDYVKRKMIDFHIF